jgi:hypothetical protein
MTQNALAPINPATTSGSDLATKLVNNEESVLTQYAGSSRPTYAQSGTLWLDTTTNPWLWKVYNGTTDIILAAFSTGASGREREGVAEASIASAGTTNVLGSTSKFVSITGSASITSLGSEPNVIKFVRAASGATFTLTHNATSLILPTGANITAAAGDNFIAISDASGNARVMAYQRASGAALVSAAGDIPSGSIALFRQTAAPTGWTKDTSNFNNHAIRIVTGAASSGGSLDFSTVFGYTATQNHTLTQANMPNYNLSAGSLTGSVGTAITGGSLQVRNLNIGSTSRNLGTGGGYQNLEPNDINFDETTISLTSGAVSFGGTIPSGGSDTAHSHNIDMQVRYVDAIWATKN